MKKFWGIVFVAMLGICAAAASPDAFAQQSRSDQVIETQGHVVLTQARKRKARARLSCSMVFICTECCKDLRTGKEFCRPKCM
jgi:hypothetical protein